MQTAMSHERISEFDPYETFGCKATLIDRAAERSYAVTPSCLDEAIMASDVRKWLEELGLGMYVEFLC